jgi:sugar phosphate permease
VESGFFPGVVLYLTFWYTRRHRVRMIAAFMSAIALAGAFGSPLSGWIMSRMSGYAGLAGWQGLFLLEGLPSLGVGLIALRFLDDGPRTAAWLTPEEREVLIARLAEEERMKAQAGVSNHRLIDAFRSGRVWLLCIVYFGFVMALYGVTFWLPQIIEDGLTRDPWRIGLVSVIPWGVGAVAMVLWGHHSDVRGERRWHLAAAGALAAVFYVVSGVPGLPPPVVVASLTLTTVGIMSGLSTFWALPTSLLSGTAAAAGIAWINSVGNLGGYVSPHVVGLIRDRCGKDMLPALVVLSMACLLSVVIVLGMKTSDRALAPHAAGARA